MSVDTAVNAKVQQLIDRQVAEGRQIGVQVAAYHEGKLVVDAVAGTRGPADSRPLQADDLILCFSVTKGVAATALHILADRGLIEYDVPVTKYWPAFGQHGKERLTVAQAMSHQAGLHYLPEPVMLEHLTDWDAGIRRMEQGVPAWDPGTATGYHAVTYAWIVGGIVQGATGRHIKDVIREEIAEPLGIADSMFVGLPDGLEDRLTTIEIHPAGEGLPIEPDHDFYKAMPVPIWQHFNGMPIRKACLPSANGHFSARALARMYAALANGGELDGVRLVSKQRLPHMQRLMTEEPDRVLLSPIRKGIGFFLGGEVGGFPNAMGPRKSAIGHSGAGGPLGFADPDVNLAVGITSNKMQYPAPGEGVTLEICDAIRNELGLA